MKLNVRIPIGVVVLLCGAAVACALLTSEGTTLARLMSDCPGTIVCPHDGDGLLQTGGRAGIEGPAFEGELPRRDAQ
jgi:hypothetical protein